MTDWTALLPDLLPIAFVVRLAAVAAALAFARLPRWCRGIGLRGSIVGVRP